MIGKLREQITHKSNCWLLMTIYHSLFIHFLQTNIHTYLWVTLCTNRFEWFIKLFLIVQQRNSSNCPKRLWLSSTSETTQSTQLFCATFVNNLTTFYSNIWSHWNGFCHYFFRSAPTFESASRPPAPSTSWRSPSSAEDISSLPRRFEVRKTISTKSRSKPPAIWRQGNVHNCYLGMRFQ